ncbi:MAG: NADH-quinone oxidoreductase subunit C [Armatimonadetes bacterium]|nr:NADH-quinone oxidoreductase subunit C [Armatimonadota bacterium]
MSEEGKSESGEELSAAAAPEPAEGEKPRPAKKARAAKPEAEPKPADPKLLALEGLLKSRLGDRALGTVIDRGMLTVYIGPEQTLETCRQLRDDPELRFNFLSCLTSLDRKEHFEVAYNLRSLDLKHEFCLRIKLPRNDPRVASVTSLWKGANWHEREAFDLMGIYFEGHPDLRRILLPDDWEGYPLRKDYQYYPADTPDHQGPPDHLLLQLEEGT